MMTLYVPSMSYFDGKMHRGIGFVVDESGRIHDRGFVDSMRQQYPDIALEEWPQRLLLPGGVNTHNHGFQVLMRGMGEDDTFMGWRSHVLYPISQNLSRDEIYQSALLAYWDMLRHGVTTVADFFYLNDQGLENAMVIAEAAREIGIRLALARTFYDWEGAPSRYRETPREARANTLALAGALRKHSLVTVQVAPHSPHGASAAMIESAVTTAHELDTRLHVHVAEGEYERMTVLKQTGKTPIAYLDDLGALTPKTLAIHAVWVDDQDLEHLKASGATVVHNPSSNMILGDGIAPIVTMLAQGIPVALGTDGGCTNDRHSIFDDMRQAALLQKVAHHNGHIINAKAVFDMGTKVGSKALGVNSGTLAIGEWFDAVTLDLDDPSLLPGPPNIAHVVYALSPTAIDGVFVAGRRVIENGRPTRFSPEMLLKWAREAKPMRMP